MRTDFIVLGPNHWNNSNYFYDETELEYGHELDDSDDKVAFGFQMSKDAVISGYGVYAINIEGACPSYYAGLTTLTGTIGDWDSGYPSDDLYNNSAWEDYNPVVLGSGWSWIDFETPVNAYKGDFVCLQIKPNLASPPNNVDFVEINTESTLASQNPGSWEFNTYWYRFRWVGSAALKLSDGTILGFPIIKPVWEEFTYPAEWGLEFKVPVQSKCIGAVLSVYQPNTDYDKPFKLILTDDNDVELASFEGIWDDIGVAWSATFTYLTWNSTTPDPILVPDITYRLYLHPKDSAGVLAKHGFIFADEESKQVMPGGADWKMIERSTPASGWTYVENGYPWMSLLITDLQLSAVSPGGNGAGYGFIG